MDDNFNNNFTNDTNPTLAQKPQFLKVLCILSIVACSLLIIIYTCGAFCLSLGQDSINSIWQKVIETQPQLEDVNPMEFFHEVGMVCLYALMANITALLGVIMMWNLNKIGFFIYAIAELSSNFFGLNMNVNGTETKSYTGTIFWILIDLIFIGMYFVNLKYMTKNKTQNSEL